MSKRKFVYFWKYVFLILVAIISIFPMYWMIVSGTNKSVDVIAGKILPGNYLMENLKSLLDTTVLSQAMWNSIRNAVVSMVLNVFAHWQVMDSRNFMINTKIKLCPSYYFP